MSLHKLDDVDFFFRMRKIVHKYPSFKNRYPLAYKWALERVSKMDKTVKSIKDICAVIDKLNLGPHGD